MGAVNLHNFRSDPMPTLRRVESGETILLELDGRGVAELRPTTEAPPVRMPRPFGVAAGEFTVPDDFDDPLPDDILHAFEGKSAGGL